MSTETIGNSAAGSKAGSRPYLLSLFIALAFALTIYPSKAEAQIVGDLVANIPFQFRAGNATLPAGEYRIHVMNDSDLAVMQISSVDGPTSGFFQVQNTDANSTPAESELIFNKYGDHYFLAKLFEEGSDTGSQVFESRDEKTISQQTTLAQVHIAANQRAQRGN